MVFKEKKSVRSVRIALGVLAGTVLIAGQVGAEEQQVQRVEITGSSIKRIQVEGALPVQRLTQEAIAKTGATSIAELIQALPAMQGFTIAAVAAGTNSGGRVSASIHNLGEEYTLVLLDGRRIAPQGDGNGVNLNAIPMSAVESVEILLDGASALYGSDAIAGVINFILKKNLQGGSAEASYGSPTDSRAGQNYNASLTYGIGNLQEDRFNILATYRHDEAAPVKSGDRSFAKTSYIPFSKGGTNYIYDRTSPSTVPANVSLTFNGGLPSIGFSPYLNKNGKCPTLNFVSLANTPTTNNCAYDFVAAVEIVPEYKRDNFFTKGTFKATNDITLFAEAALGRMDLTARIAPNVAPFTIVKDSDLFRNNVAPYLTPAQANNIKSMSGQYRTADWGSRDSQTITDTTHVVVGAEGDVGAWNFNTGLTWSRNKIDERYVGGYMLDAEFRDMLAKRAFDPFAPLGQQSDATKALIAKSIFHGSIREASTTLKGIDGHGSRELFELPGGAASIGLGGDYRQFKYKQTPSDAADDGMIYNLSAPAAYDMTRTTYGAFAELSAPLTKELELTLAGRYDSVSAIDSALEQRKVGKKETGNTYKVSARWTPIKTLLLRGSYGTGFKAPGMLDIAQPLVAAGVTANSYECPIASNEFCKPGRGQYPVVSGGNEELRPERSKQYTLGFRIEPNASFTFGADLWSVKMTDQVSSVSEQQIFGDPVKFRSLFTTFKEVATGNVYWAKKTQRINIGKSENRGIDYDLVARHRFSFGNFTATMNGTYLMKSDYTAPGTDNQWTNSLNVFGIDNAVAFRHIVRTAGSLETGALTNTLTMNYRNGYEDADTSVRNLTTNKNENLRLHVPSYITFDWQGRYMFTKTASLRAGIKNLLNREPPLSLRASSGHQVGYDARYADPMLRTFYVTGNMQF
ncbi:TonB-dependent receptor [Rugamonas sp. CCM 8940]|uniref:TonB-dependent receptor n=1 Tax=Rugamonas sp. CCM 8940 TaxID=2765359 RepID=UPI0018F5F284|nr:TonB-dependent receptor [Rugamonas sp. CCM 8940]MBJ7308601.1 TonB-dependent receptor [Rugamonas sp. CCM 8940]